MGKRGGVHLDPGLYTIREAAQASGLSERQIRYLERRGAVAPVRVMRGTSAYRAYNLDNIRVLTAIRTVRKQLRGEG